MPASITSGPGGPKGTDNPGMAPARTSGFLRQAHRAWNLLHVDSAQARTLAQGAIEGASKGGDDMKVRDE